LLALVSAFMISAMGMSVRGQGQVSQPTQGDASQAAVEAPAGSAFSPPRANQCQSKYDRFYSAEPGVYAYWALCESGKPVQIYDYVGPFDLTAASHSFGAGPVAGGFPGPVPDGESAANVPTARLDVESQGIHLNSQQGTVAAWINADAQSYPVTAVFLGAVQGKSRVAIGVRGVGGICFQGDYTSDDGRAVTVEKCGFEANSWHRVALAWIAGNLSLYVDGASVAAGRYVGALDDKVFYYKLFPGCCNTGKQMTLAKALVANQAWDPSQAKSDFSPTFPPVPRGGVYVTSRRLGTIHRNVLGFADRNQDISSPEARAALLSGLASAGATSLRYGGGYGGIEADLEDWKGRGTCTKVPGAMGKTPNDATGNHLDSYLESVARQLRLQVVFTVNYGTNPPSCDQGGDPKTNGADLVQYANRVKNYGIKYWEIGNELYAGGSEPDFHPNPNSGESYAQYEPGFYSAMKAQDRTIEIAVPIGLGVYSWETSFDQAVLARASYDAVVFHSYPVKDPISDGATLYRDRVASNLGRVRGELLELQTVLMSHGKSPDAIWVTEWDGEVGGNKWSKQTMGAAAPLFVASQLAEFMEAGVRIANWWTEGTPNVCSTMNYDGNGETAYSWWECGSTALVYTGPAKGRGEVAVGLRPGDLTPAGRGFQILSQSGFVGEGEHMLRTETDPAEAPWLLSYAATHGGSYAVILINRDRDEAHTVPVGFADLPSGSQVRQWSYGRAQYDRSRAGDWSAAPVQSTHAAWSKTFHATLPPWSVNVLVFAR